MHRIPIFRHRVRSFAAEPPSAHSHQPYRLKALLFALVRAFEFALAVPQEDIVPMGLLVQRPLVRTELDKGSQLPMIIRPYQQP